MIKKNLFRLSWHFWRRSQCRNYCSTADAHVGIVGSGPAAFYTAQQLLKGCQNLKVDIYEQLPVPFGLVRYGVAPDHPEVKNVINTFSKVVNNDRCSFVGNVSVGKDVSLAQLREAYTAVVLAYGANSERCLNIQGENLPNVISARNFVGWYNGLPENQNLELNLDVEDVAIVGHGNVALDIARILLTPLELLKKTDITEKAIKALSSSKVQRVHLIGRRGPLQVAFTIKEFREMTRLPKSRPVLDPDDFKHLADYLEDLPRPRRRLTELLYNTAVKPLEKDQKMWADATRTWHLHFLRSPVEILSEGLSIKGLRLVKNKLEGPIKNNPKAVSTHETIDLSCGMILTSIGYKGVKIDPDLPFDHNKGVVANENGRVIGVPGLYCTGWVSRGPLGVILNTMTDGIDTGKLILKDLKDNRLEVNKPGKDVIIKKLKEAGVQTVSFDDWKKIDSAEILKGESAGKPREKMVDISEMLNLVTKETS